MDSDRAEQMRAATSSRGWDGFVVVLATDPARSSELFTELGALVEGSTGSVLISMRNPAPWWGGAFVGVQPRRNHDGALGGRCWIGPLAAGAECAALLRWLRGGGPATCSVPGELAHRTLPTPRLQAAN